MAISICDICASLRPDSKHVPRNGDANAAWPATPYVTQRPLRPAEQHGVVSMTLTARSSSSSPRAGTLCVEDHPVTYEGYTRARGGAPTGSGFRHNFSGNYPQDLKMV